MELYTYVYVSQNKRHGSDQSKTQGNLAEHTLIYGCNGSQLHWLSTLIDTLLIPN